MSLFLVVLALAAQEPVPAVAPEVAPDDTAPSADVAPPTATTTAPATAPLTTAAPATAPVTTTAAPVTPPDNERARVAGWTVAGASAAGFVGGALFAVPAMLSLPFGPLIGVAIGFPVLALAAAFGAFVAELGVARVTTSLAVSGLAGGGALVGTSVGVLAGWGIGSVVSADSLVPALTAIAGGALGGLGGAATGGGLGALWLTPDER